MLQNVLKKSMHLWQQRQEKYWMSINPSAISAVGWQRKKSTYICTGRSANKDSFLDKSQAKKLSLFLLCCMLHERCKAGNIPFGKRFVGKYLLNFTYLSIKNYKWSIIMEDMRKYLKLLLQILIIRI